MRSARLYLMTKIFTIADTREKFETYLEHRFRREGYDPLKARDAYRQLIMVAEKYINEEAPTEVVGHMVFGAGRIGISDAYAELFEKWGLLETQEIRLKRRFLWYRRVR